MSHFRHFVEATKFAIITDAMSLTFLKSMSINSKSPRIARWAMKIQGYDIEFKYRKGKDNVCADALSRAIYSIKTDLTDVPYEELKEQIVKHPERHKDYKIVDDRIYRFVTNASKADDPSFRWKYIPKANERSEIIKTIHNLAHL